MLKLVFHIAIVNSRLSFRSLALYIILFSVLQTHAQPGSNDHVGLVLRIQDSRTGQEIKGLKIYLIDEYHVPYTAKTSEWNASTKKFDFSYDTLVFHDNKDIKHPRGENLEHRHRQSFPGLESCYVIEIPSLEIDRITPTQIPIYQAKVVDVDGEKNGGYFPTRIFRLDYRDAIPLHQKGCHVAPQPGSYFYSIQTVNGDRFLPSSVFLDLPTFPDPAFDPLSHMYRQVIDTLRCTNGTDSLYGLRSVVIRNWYSLLKIKEIEPSNSMYLGNEGIKKVLELGDYLERNPAGIMDIRIWVKRIKNELDQFEDYYDVYCYNSDNESYDRIPQLSDFPNIEMQSITEPIRRKNVGLENGRIYERYFILKDLNWVMINEAFHIPNPSPKLQEPLSACVQWLDDRSHLSKVYFHSNAQSNVEVTHRFKYLNTCRTTYQPLPFRSSHDPYFSAAKSVAPGDTGWVQFKAIISAHSTGLQPIGHMAYVPTADNPHHSVNIEFFVAHIEWVQQWHANGTPALVMIERGDGLANALVIDEEGYPVESGTYYPDDQQKIGTWQRFNRNGVKSHINYGRIVHANIAWPTDIMEEVNIMVYRNGKWMAQETHIIHGDRKMYIYEKIDSILILAGSGIFKQPIYFDQLANENWLHIQLIYPDQIPLPMANSAVGIEFLTDTYGIEWDHVYISTNFNLGTKSTVDLNTLLQKRHPHIELILGHCDYCCMISLSHLSAYQRVQVLEELLRDSMILHLNQVFRMNRGAITYCHGDATMRVNYNLSYPKVQAKLESFGFVYRDQVFGAAGLYSVNWPHKLRGLDFIQALQMAAKDSDISHISPSLYFEPKTETWQKVEMRD
jgi:hypothetical protein